jgi:hypothetical protein
MINYQLFQKIKLLENCELIINILSIIVIVKSKIGRADGCQ